MAARLRGSADLLVGAALVLVAATLAFLMPLGHPVRFAITLLVLTTVPGYLLIQAVLRPAQLRTSRAIHVALGVGLSPAVVGLLALLTVLFPGGFLPFTIIATVTVACLVMVAVAFRRRSSRPTEAAAPSGPEPSRV